MPFYIRVPSLITPVHCITITEEPQLQSTQGQSVWQKNYYEHIIRDEVSLTKIREYIVNNPLKWHQDIENQQVKPSQEEVQFWQSFGRKDL